MFHLKILRTTWFVPNDIIKTDLSVKLMEEEIKKLTQKYGSRLKSQGTITGEPEPEMV